MSRRRLACSISKFILSNFVFVLNKSVLAYCARRARLMCLRFVGGALIAQMKTKKTTQTARATYDFGARFGFVVSAWPLYD